MSRSRRSARVLIAFLGLAAPAFAAAQSGIDLYGPRPLWERVELTLTVGYGRSLADWTSLHLLQSSTPSSPGVSAQNRLQMSAQGTLFGGASATFFFRSGMVLQGGFGYLKAGVSNDTYFEFRYDGPPALSRSETFAGTGELTTIPVYLNIVNAFNVVRGPASRKFKAYVFLGPALFFNSIFVNGFAGAAAVVPAGGGGAPAERADAFKVPVTVEDKSWVSIGGDIGLGLDYQIARPLALTLDGRFFYAPKKNLGWKWEVGQMSGLYGNIPQLDFTEAMSGDNMENTTPITLKPSFFQISAGIKIIF